MVENRREIGRRDLSHLYRFNKICEGRERRQFLRSHAKAFRNEGLDVEGLGVGEIQSDQDAGTWRTSPQSAGPTGLAALLTVIPGEGGRSAGD